jgi:hypothetical protein
MLPLDVNECAIVLGGARPGQPLPPAPLIADLIGKLPADARSRVRLALHLDAGDDLRRLASALSADLAPGREPRMLGEPAAAPIQQPAARQTPPPATRHPAPSQVTYQPAPQATPQQVVYRPAPQPAHAAWSLTGESSLLVDRALEGLAVNKTVDMRRQPPAPPHTPNPTPMPAPPRTPEPLRAPAPEAAWRSDGSGRPDASRGAEPSHRPAHAARQPTPYPPLPGHSTQQTLRQPAVTAPVSPAPSGAPPVHAPDPAVAPAPHPGRGPHQATPPPQPVYQPTPHPTRAPHPVHQPTPPPTAAAYRPAAAPPATTGAPAAGTSQAPVRSQPAPSASPSLEDSQPLPRTEIRSHRTSGGKANKAVREDDRHTTSELNRLLGFFDEIRKARAWDEEPAAGATPRTSTC